MKEVEGFLERTKQQRKEGRKRHFGDECLHSILHGWLAQVNGILVVFGGASFEAKAVLNRPLTENESHWA